MGATAERLQRLSHSLYKIGDNPHVGQRVHVTWLRPWGGKQAGFEAEGELKATFAVNGRTLIGEIRVPAPNGEGTRKLTCPWSRNYLKIEPA